MNKVICGVEHTAIIKKQHKWITSYQNVFAWGFVYAKKYKKHKYVQAKMLNVIVKNLICSRILFKLLTSTNMSYLLKYEAKKVLSHVPYLHYGQNEKQDMKIQIKTSALY